MADTKAGIVAGFRAQMDLVAENDRLRKAVQYAADVFDDYYRQHWAKDTSDGYAKAERNKRRRDMMRAALKSDASAMSAFGQDPPGLEAKPASAAPQEDARG